MGQAERPPLQARFGNTLTGPVKPGRIDWLAHEIGSGPATTPESPTIKHIAQPEFLSNPNVPFNRFTLEQFANHMIAPLGGRIEHDGTRFAIVRDETAKEGEISSVSFTSTPKNRNAGESGGTSIVVTQNFGDGKVVEKLLLGRTEPRAIIDYHNATLLTSKEFTPDTSSHALYSQVTGEQLPEYLADIRPTELPETGEINDNGEQGPSLQQEGREFCKRLLQWVNEVNKGE